MNKLLLIFVICATFFSIFVVLDVDARCIGPYPCRGHTERPLAVDYWKYSDTVIKGKVVAKLYNENAFENFNSHNLKNPCSLITMEKKLTVDMEKPFSQRIQNNYQPTKNAELVTNSNFPFKIRLQVEDTYKGMVFFKYLDVYGTKRVDGQQFSKGYVQLILKPYNTSKMMQC